VLLHSESLAVATRGRGTYEITESVQRAVQASGVQAGLCNVFVHHTSASLIVCENADPSVRADLERFFARLVPDGDPLFRHTMEGPDDMPAHVRSVLTQASLGLPVAGARCDLGTWQGVYLWEHRARPHLRRLTISVIGRAGD
jgi:secondary thiamine-phosphate synthase enzyme